MGAAHVGCCCCHRSSSSSSDTAGTGGSGCASGVVRGGAKGRGMGF